mmetsp:Transcript_314/g.514  ORF Transcript_314/g.514 Transcript_314/m.514 type:complete len:201 (-) Transcript_314:121-723(-)
MVAFRSLFTSVSVLLFLCCLVSPVVAEETSDASNEEICNEETAVINQNPDVLQAVVALQADVEDILSAESFRDYCKVLSRKCKADLADYSSDLKTKCTAAGGQFVELDQKLGCSGEIVGSLEIPGTVEILNIPGCIGPSCDTKNLTSDIVDTLSSLIKDAETAIEKALGDRIECEASSSSGNNLWFASLGILVSMLVALL